MLRDDWLIDTKKIIYIQFLSITEILVFSFSNIRFFRKDMYFYHFITVRLSQYYCTCDKSCARENAQRHILYNKTKILCVFYKFLIWEKNAELRVVAELTLRRIFLEIQILYIRRPLHILYICIIRSLIYGV